MIRQGEASALFSLQLTATTRIFGIRDRRVLKTDRSERANPQRVTA